MQLQRQYELVQSSRNVLLDYCYTLSPDHFTEELTSFGRGSIRNLLVHIGNTYQFWLGKHGLSQPVLFKEYQAVKTVKEAADYFKSIDNLVAVFISTFESKSLVEMRISLADKTITVTPLQLFTHVITHEFHHKGQILSLSRRLGYTPVDTDIIR